MSLLLSAQKRLNAVVGWQQYPQVEAIYMNQTMQPLDWVVLCGYALGMLAIGLYFSYRAKSSEDYMFGGRRMNPLAVGLSLFATLMSAISYLSWPGEIVRYGPAMFLGLIAYPFIYLVVGWLLIPRIMKANVSSAYELLEKQLGRQVRLLAGIFFLIMRITWMAVIIYMSSEKIIVPVMKWPASSVLWISIVLGVVTVIYTSLGGLRAVVATDVIQSLILFSGAVATVIIITIRMGGVSGWWPTAWQSNWSPFQFGYDPHARVTLIGAFIAWFGWYICTAGSDQMAIQRYISTRNIKTARRAQLVSLVSDSLITILLALVGLAVFGFFRSQPQLLPPQWGISTHADQLFPHFIVIGFPAGLTGLVVAGLLAAAMSSLSSGINSAALVISKDLLDRYLRPPASDREQVIREKIISFGLGFLVVVLSTLVGMVSGNLLEVTYKTVNLLVAPLFVPFFMVYFIPSAKGTSVFIGMLASVATAACIAFWKDITGVEGISFLWIIPLSFAAGVIVSLILSQFESARKTEN